MSKKSRDPKRIDKILKTLGLIWREEPDIRFFQLIYNLELNLKNELDKDDLFYLEDDKVKEFLDKYYSEIKINN